MSFRVRRARSTSSMSFGPALLVAKSVADGAARAVAASAKSPVRACNIDFSADNLSAADILALNTYDFMAHLGKTVINPGGRAGRDEILASLSPPAGAHVLEIGCGTGETACFVARRYHCTVAAVDVSPAMIAGAKARALAQGLEHRVDCRVADVLALPFPDNSFDYVVCQAVLMFVDKGAALREIQRVLRPGGVFAGLEFSWKRAPTDEVRSTTYAICGCRTLEFHAAPVWGATLAHAGLTQCEARERRFNMLSIAGFLRDEGVVNTLKILARLCVSAARLRRMAQIWQHFSRHRAYFSYTVLRAQKQPPAMH